MEKDPRIWKMAQDRVSFKRHLIIYLVVNAVLWLIWLVTNLGTMHGSWTFPWPVYPMLGWGIAIIVQYLKSYTHFGSDSVDTEYDKLKKKQDKND